MKQASSTTGPDGDFTRRLIQCFREVFPEVGDETIVNAQVDRFEKWDSLASVTLVVIVEDEFLCTLPDSLVAELTSFEKILDALKTLSE